MDRKKHISELNFIVKKLTILFYLFLSILFLDTDLSLASEAITQSVFPDDNIWNARVDSLPVHSKSDEFVESIGSDCDLHPDFGTFWEGEPIGIPYVLVDSSQTKVNVSFTWADESDDGPYPIPADVPIEGGSSSTGDRHVIVLDQDSGLLYEMYNSFPNQDGSWSADSGAIFDLNSNSLRPETWTSADAAGLPILPGLIRYDEVQSGEINHAIRFTAAQTRRDYVWPARHYASSITDENVPSMGQRFRLKASFDISGYSQQNQVILTALKQYGMILADNGSNWFISGTHDTSWDNEELDELKQVIGSDFEAVDVSSLMVDYDSGQVNTNEGFFDEYILIQNPNSIIATITVTLMKTDGTTEVESLTIDPTSRHTLHVDDIVQNKSLSAKIESSIGVIAERAMYWDAGGNTWAGGHASIGVPAIATEWFLAEGYTGGNNNFDAWILLQNPNSTAATTIVTFMQSDGTTTPLNITIDPTARYSVHVNDYIDNDSFSTKVTSSIGIISERAMYWDAGGNTWADGHCSIGVTQTSEVWYLAEGCTDGFDEYVLVQNPSNSPATCIATFMFPDGDEQTLNFEVDATSRYTIYVNDFVQNKSVSTKVQSTNNAGIIAERAMYWPVNDVPYSGGHCSVGITTPAQTWYLAEGSTAGTFDEWILIQNPGNTSAQCQVTFMKSDGTTVVDSFTVDATGRFTIHVNDYITNDSVSAAVATTNGTNIIVERSMYWLARQSGGDDNNITWISGHCSSGVTAASTEWFFAEGAT